MNTRSLSFRLVTWYAGLLTLVFIFLGVLTLVFLRNTSKPTCWIPRRGAHGRLPTRSSHPSVVPARQAMARRVEELYSPEANDRFIRVTSNDGQGDLRLRRLRTTAASFPPSSSARPDAHATICCAK